jgi:hypothetical protein
MTESKKLAWRKNAGSGFALHLGGGRSRALLEVVPDKIHAGMWRIQTPDGRHSDMANLVRVKDAALSVAVRSFNFQRLGGETPAEAPPIAPNRLAAASPHLEADLPPERSPRSAA